jgi:hypothetical protein
MIRNETVLHGKDNEALDILLALHAVADPVILDCTYNKGKMWQGTSYRPLRMDINPAFGLDVCADFAAMPFADASFDVIVFDPPHLPTHAASPGSSRMWEKRYGITGQDKRRDADHVCGLFNPFLVEAKRVLRSPEGVILAKIADLVHNHRQQWQQVDFINAVREVGMTPCDMLIKCDPLAGNLKSSKWENVMHLRKAHCYWIVVRNSTKCERKKHERYLRELPDL